MRLAKCVLPDGGTIIVQVRERTARTFRGGDTVDLDEVLVPARAAEGDRKAVPAVTWADALGHHVDDHFAVDGAPGPAVALVADEGE